MTIRVGNKIRLSDGYYFEPRYLQNPQVSFIQGTVIKFIKDQGESQAAVVRLDHVVHGDKISGDIAILELRYQGDTWANPTAVHIELCDFIPEDKPWKDRQQGEWIEGAASINVKKWFSW